MKTSIWNFWADKYDTLWVQKYSLKPTRNYILEALSQFKGSNHMKVLDLGCGSGQLIAEISKCLSSVEITGIDFSEKMLEISKSRNPQACHINLNAEELHKLGGSYDLIICTHSLPYYKKPESVMKELSRLLADNGKILMGFASGNSLYDKFILSFVKLTTGPANYPSDREFRNLASPHLLAENLKIIKEKSFMPRIAVYTLRKASI